MYLDFHHRCCSHSPQLAENYGMEFFETSASNNSNISEVGYNSTEWALCQNRNLRKYCGDTQLHSFSCGCIFFSPPHFLLPPVVHSCGRTSATGSQERCRLPVRFSGWLSGEGRSGGPEAGSEYRGRHTEDLCLLGRRLRPSFGCCWRGKFSASFNFY